MWRNKHVNVAATLTYCALGDAVPLVQIEEVEKWRRKLNLPLPEDVMSADGAPELDALYDNGSEVTWFSKIKHPVPPFSKCLTFRITGARRSCARPSTFGC